MRKKIVENPGSDEAVKLGCKCPALDNNHGKGVPSEEGPLFWFSGECAYHQKYPILSATKPTKE